MVVVVILLSSGIAFGWAPGARGAGIAFEVGSTTTNQQSRGVSPEGSPLINVPALETLLSIYAVRPDLQAAYPNATENLTSLARLVTWASEVVRGEFLDFAYAELAAPEVGYYLVLLGIYNSRSDLQVGFPNAYTNVTSYGRLLWWADKVTADEQFVDSAYTTLLPWAFAYDLFGLYENRSDLQTAFPNALTNATEETQLVNWAGGVVDSAIADSSDWDLLPNSYWYVLMYVYDGRSDLQAAYPNAWGNATSYTRLVNWAGGVVTDQYIDADNTTLNTTGYTGYIYDLLMVYDGRADLQAAYPNAYSNSTSYANLLAWAEKVVEKVDNDSAYTVLQDFAPYYEIGTPFGWLPLGVVLDWGRSLNETGSTIAGCPQATGHYCYTVAILEAGDNISTANILRLLLRNDQSVTVSWPSDGVSVSFVNAAVVVATYLPANSTWDFEGSYDGAITTSLTLVIYTASTGPGQGLTGEAIVAQGTTGYVGFTNSSGSFP